MAVDAGYAWQLWIYVTLLCTAQANSCQTYHLTNAAYNPGTNGYYDLMADEKCTDHPVYQQRNPDGDENNTSLYYMYYNNPDQLNYGWAVGRSPCSKTVYVYNWNNNKRPDYTLRYWIEREGNTWYYSFDLRVKCTEGLSYGELIGVIIASIIAVPILGVCIYFIVKSIKSKRKARRRRTNPGNNTTSGSMPSTDRAMPSVDYGVPNYAFNNSDGTMYPTFDMAQPFHVMAPPLYEEISADTSSPFTGDVNGNESKPPTYDDVIAEMTEPQAAGNNRDMQTVMQAAGNNRDIQTVMQAAGHNRDIHTVMHGESSGRESQSSITSIEVMSEQETGGTADCAADGDML